MARANPSHAVCGARRGQLPLLRHRQLSTATDNFFDSNILQLDHGIKSLLCLSFAFAVFGNLPDVRARSGGAGRCASRCAHKRTTAQGTAALLRRS